MKRLQTKWVAVRGPYGIILTNRRERKMNEDKILVPLDDYEEKAKDQRTVEIIRDMVIREGDVAVNTLCVLLGIMGEPWKK